MQIDILSLFPGYFKGPFDESIIKRAQDSGLVAIRHVDIREFADNKHRRVDDRPYGGGPGMVLMPRPVAMAIRSVRLQPGGDQSSSEQSSKQGSKVVYLSPQGKPLTAAICRKLAQEKHLILLCGHYEGIDQRVLDSDVDEEISIGDFVLTNGCLAAIVLVDAMIRFIPGVLGHAAAADEDSFEASNAGILDCPHYTRPELFEDKAVPAVLLSGDHKKIATWRNEAALEKTRRVRPDLLRQMLKQI